MAEWIKLLDVEQVGMGSNPTSGGFIQNYQIGNFYRDYSSLHTRSARYMTLQTDYGLYRLLGLTAQKCYRSLNCKTAKDGLLVIPNKNMLKKKNFIFVFVSDLDLQFKNTFDNYLRIPFKKDIFCEN